MLLVPAIEFTYGREAVEFGQVERSFSNELSFWTMKRQSDTDENEVWASITGCSPNERYAMN